MRRATAFAWLAVSTLVLCAAAPALALLAVVMRKTPPVADDA